MTLAVVKTRAALGIDAPSVSVEVHLGGGLPSLSLVGLPNTAVREARDRVRGALNTSGFEFPRRRITVNLAPADLPKDGGRFDLAIALGILAASGQIRASRLKGCVFCAELALSGELRPVPGCLPTAIRCAEADETLVVCSANAAEAALAEAPVLAAEHLLAVCDHINGAKPLPGPTKITARGRCSETDLADVMGQSKARRALEIAAAGGHSLLFSGPPGSGKSLLASRLPGLMPPMTRLEAMQSAAIRSVAENGFNPELWGQRPFRHPHHSASSRALTGGGNPPKPGEVSLAHHGVLFLDELPEFPRHALEALREPLETAEIHIARASRSLRFPAEFQLIAAMNPCPCGYLGDNHHTCRCTPHQIRQYRNRISGPLLDRIDLQVDMPRLTPDELERMPAGEDTATVAKRVQAARERQLRRNGCPAARLPASLIRTYCRIDRKGQLIMREAGRRLGLSARSWHRCLRVARTIADLNAAECIQARHIEEALTYRERTQTGYSIRGT